MVRNAQVHACMHLCVRARRRAGFPAKVGDLGHQRVSWHEHVGWLQITMHNPQRVDVLKAAQQSMDEMPAYAHAFYICVGVSPDV